MKPSFEFPVVGLMRPLSNSPDVDPPPWLSIQPYDGMTDEEGWLRIQNEVLAERGVTRDWGKAQFHRQLSSRPDWQPNRLLLARVEGQVEPVATAVYWPDASARWVRLQWLLVRPAYRRRGIARELLAEVERCARRMGRLELRVETLRTWQGAIGFYAAMGFREVPLEGPTRSLG